MKYLIITLENTFFITDKLSEDLLRQSNDGYIYIVDIEEKCLLVEWQPLNEGDLIWQKIKKIPETEKIER